MEKLLSIGEAAQLLGVSVSTVRNWTEKKLITAVILPSGYRRYRLMEVDRLRRQMGLDSPEHSPKIGGMS